ncbi:MAG: DUF350 domain-containing protein [Calditrichaeota bacterium]|nr:MAG: DUF350 domain-containing protein [Calditrichota bacterium]
MEKFINVLFDTEPVAWLVQFEGAVYFVVVFLILYFARLMYDMLTPFSLNDQLTSRDNKAVAVSFGGYMAGVLLVLLGVLQSGGVGNGQTPAHVDLIKDLLDTLIWGVIGVALLNIARLINDTFILRKFSVIKELTDDRNIGVGAVLWGGYLGSALIVQAAISGESNGWGMDIALSVLYFLIGQAGFILYAYIFQWQTRFDVHAEIERDNAAAGVSFGLSLLAVGILLAGYLHHYDSIPGFFVWLVISWFVLAVSRYLSDKWVLPGALLDEEIAQDGNWGAALVEGSIAVVIALLMIPVFLI